ncbi:chlorophyllase-1 [Tripterygium wilfordii]|uniref:Chlorophyllase-1 n=1 Tax=Tripterygium wilfordii TaxID=458696 RepID=A0A7J7D6M3_TRIWF|nr:chlorophyllase-1 [Tripterygium wilfordii]KAF5741909.1 chlorophyllase-1 [Tripterygium wilfordii]
MAVLEAMPRLNELSIFAPGPHSVQEFSVETSSSSKPPKPLFIVTPTEPGKYPILQFYHGTVLINTYYRQVLQLIASHGYIVVAPQLYQPWDVVVLMCACLEVQDAGKVINWLPKPSPEGLQSVLPENVTCDTTQIGLAGHSRGGKTAFAVALGDADTNLKFQALIGIDPVAGSSKSICCRTCPHILTYKPQSFDLSIPVTVIGTGLGGESVSECMIPMPACAPEGVNHTEFYRECKAPCGRYVATDYGHMDMLDDDLGLYGNVCECMCKKGKAQRDPMRRFVGGIVVASLKAGFNGDFVDLKTIAEDPQVAPVKLQDSQYTE